MTCVIIADDVVVGEVRRPFEYFCKDTRDLGVNVLILYIDSEDL